MKNRKILTLAAVTLLLVFVAGCGKNATEGNAPAPGNTAQTPANSAPSNSNNNTSSSSQTTNNNNSSSATQTQPKQDAPKAFEKVDVGPLKPGEPGKIGPLTVTLKQTNVVDKAAGLPQGYIHLMAEIVVSNEAAAVYTMNITDHFKLETPEAKKAPYNVQATANRSPRLQGSVEQGKSSTGWIGYLSKKVAGKYKYQFIHPEWGTVTWEFSL